MKKIIACFVLENGTYVEVPVDAVKRIRHYIAALGINKLEQLVPQIATAILIPVIIAHQ